MAVKKLVGSDNGLLSPPKYVNKVLTINAYGQSPDFFDKLTAEKVYEISDFVDREFASVSKSEIKSGSLSFRLTKINQEFNVRKSGEYFVMQTELINDSPELRLKAGTTVYACYFFKKVK